MKKISFNLPEKFFGIERDFLKFFWILAVLFLIFLVSLKFVILPKIGEIISIINQMNTQNAELRAVREKLNYLVAIDKNELNKNADFLNSALLKQRNSFVLVNIVKIIADQFGYQIRSFSVTPGELKGEDSVAPKLDVVSKLPVNLVVVGPRERYLDFVSSLEKNLPILTVDKFDLTSNEGLSQIDLTVSAYYVQESMNGIIANFSLTDLTLNKEESDVLQNISSFQKNSGINTGIGQTGVFTRYTRENPFSF